MHALFITDLLLAVNFIISLLSAAELRTICHKQFSQLHALFINVTLYVLCPVSLNVCHYI